jgi:hypothetical protein
LSAIETKKEDAHSKNTRRERRRRDVLYVRALWALANDSAARRRRERTGITHFCNATNSRDFLANQQATISQLCG